MTAATGLLASLSGSLIGLILGLVGGRGSILAVPLLISVVGIGSTHAAIGTGAIAVALNAAIGLAAYWRAGTIRRGCASVLAAAGVVGAAPGAELGKTVPGERLLGLFGLLMAAVGLAMLRSRRAGDDRATHLTRGTARWLRPRGRAARRLPRQWRGGAWGRARRPAGAHPRRARGRLRRHGAADRAAARLGAGRLSPGRFPFAFPPGRC